MSRLIDADAHKARLEDARAKYAEADDFVSHCMLTAYDLAIGILYHEPTVEAEPIRHGRWFLLDECSNAGVYCNVCQKKVFREDAWYANAHLKSKYCPICGAKMSGEKENVSRRL